MFHFTLLVNVVAAPGLSYETGGGFFFQSLPFKHHLCQVFEKLDSDSQTADIQAARLGSDLNWEVVPGCAG